MEVYIEKFQNLSGSSISEYHKNFNNYIQEIKSSSVDKKELLNNLHPEFPQQEIFYTRIAIEFENREKMLDILKSGNPLMIKTLLRKTDVYIYFAEISADEFLEEISPNISNSTRQKLINKICETTRDFNYEDFFLKLSPEYGMEICKPLLVKSYNAALIRDFIENTGIYFKSNELIEILKNHGLSVLTFYFENRPKLKFAEYKKLVNYMIFNHTKSFVEMLKFGYPKIGRKGFKQLLRKDNLGHFSLSKFPDLDLKNLYYLLPLEDYFNICKQTLPDDLNEFIYSKIDVVLKRLSKEKRGDFLFRVFREKYGFEMYASLDYVNANLLGLLALEDRLKFLKLKDGFAEMLGVEDSIPFLKEKINSTTNSSSRSIFVNKLAETCKINDDLEALKEVLKYANKRHKNDDYALRNAFYQIIINSFKHDSLDDEIWNLLCEAVDVFTVNKEFFDGIEQFLETQIHKKHTKGINFENDLIRYMRDTGVYMNWNLLRKQPLLERECILQMENLIPKAFTSVEDRKDSYDSFFWTITDYNKRNRKRKISFLKFPTMMRFIKTSHNAYILNAALKSKPENKVEVEIFENVLESKTNGYPENVSFWLLENRPEFISKNIKVFFHVDDDNFRFLKRVAKFQHLKLHEDFLKASLQIVSNPKGNDKALAAAFCFLSLIPQRFSVLEKYLFNTENPEDLKKLLQILNRNNNNPGKNLKIIKFYLQSKFPGIIKGLLYKTINNLTEEMLLRIIENKFIKKVSVNKTILEDTFSDNIVLFKENNEAFGLISHLLKTDDSFNLIQTNFLVEENRQLFIFKCLLKISSRKQIVWDFVIKHLTTLKQPFIPKLKYVHKNKISLILNELFKLELNTEIKYHLLKQLDPKSIGPDLLEIILEYYLRNESDDAEIINFTYNIFLQNPNLIKNLGVIKRILEKIPISLQFFDSLTEVEMDFASEVVKKKRKLENNIKIKESEVNFIKKLVMLFCEKSLQENENNSQATNLLKNVQTKYSNLKDYYTVILLNLTVQYLESGFEKIHEILLMLNKNYATVKFVFTEAINKFFKLLDGDFAKQRLSLVEELLGVSKDQSVLFLAIALLPSSIPKQDILSKKYYALIEEIENCNVSVVDVYLRKHIMLCLE